MKEDQKTVCNQSDFIRLAEEMGVDSKKGIVIPSIVDFERYRNDSNRRKLETILK